MIVNGSLDYATVSEVWGDDPTAKALIDAWGMDVFRRSAIHQAALLERARKPKQKRGLSSFRPDPKVKK